MNFHSEEARIYHLITIASLPDTVTQGQQLEPFCALELLHMKGYFCLNNKWLE